MRCNAEKAPKRPPERPKTTPQSTKTTPGAPKNDPKTTPKQPKKRPRTTKRKKDRTKTILGPSWTAPGPISTVQRRPRGSILEAKTAPKSIPKRSKIEEKNQGEKTDPRRSWIRLEAILGRLGCHLGALETLWHYACRCFVKFHFFDVKTVRRRSWDQLWPIKAPKRPKLTPKTEPKSTPRRSKIDVKIVIKNDAKSKRAGVVLVRKHWAGTPPQGAAPGTQGRRPRAHGTSKKS